MSLGGGKTTTVENRDPWGPSQPHLISIMDQGKKNFEDGVGSDFYKGPVMAAQDPYTAAALQSIGTTASKADTSQAFRTGNSMMANNGLTDDMRTNLAGLSAMANGEAGRNPVLMDMLESSGRRAANASNLSASAMGRYGSGGHAEMTARGVQEAQNPLISAAYENDMGRKLAAMNSTAGILNSGADRAGQWASMMPQINDLMYDPANRLAAVGAYGDQRAQAEHDASIMNYNREQNMPNELLGSYLNSVQGLTGIIGNAGTTTRTGETPGQSPLGLIGGGLMTLLSL